MDNISFLYKELFSSLLDKKNFGLYKSYLSNFYKKDYISEKDFLSFFNLCELNFENKFIKKNINLNYNFLIDKPFIVFYNGFYSFSKNLEIEIIDLKRQFFLKKFNVNFLNFINNNLNFFYILNEVISNKNYYLKFPEKSKCKEIYILNLSDEKFKNYFFNSNIYIDIFSKNKIIFNNIYINKSNKSLLNLSLFFNLKKNSDLSYKFFDFSFKETLNTCSIYSIQDYNSNLYYSDNFFSEGKFCGFYNICLNEKKSIFKNKSVNNLNNNSYKKIDFNLFHYNNYTESNLNFNSILNNDSSYILKGRVYVSFDIDSAFSNLLCRGMVLSKFSKITLIPKLDICSENVKCSHGASIGFLSNDIRYYMISRGISYNNCNEIIVKSFVLDCIEKNKFILNFLSNEYMKLYYY